MVFTAKVKRIGGSTYVLIPPEVARTLDLGADAEVDVEIHPSHPTAHEVMESLYGIDPGAEPFDRDELWGDYGKRDFR